MISHPHWHLSRKNKVAKTSSAQYNINLPRKNRKIPKTNPFTNAVPFRTQGNPKYWKFMNRISEKFLLYTVLFIEHNSVFVLEVFFYFCNRHLVVLPCFTWCSHLTASTCIHIGCLIVQMFKTLSQWPACYLPRWKISYIILNSASDKTTSATPTIQLIAKLTAPW